MTTSVNTRVAGNIRAELGRQNRTQEQLAEQVSMARQTISHRLSGRTPLSLDDVERIAAALKVEPARLLDLS